MMFLVTTMRLDRTNLKMTIKEGIMEQTKFVSIVLDKEYVGSEYTSKDGKKMVLLKTPDGMHFSRPTSQVKLNEKTGKHYFSLPENYTVVLQRHKKDPGSNEFICTEEITIDPNKLKEMFNLDPVKSEFLAIEISKKQVVKYLPGKDGAEMAMILTNDGRTFLRDRLQLRESRTPGKFVFSVPNNDDYKIALRESKRDASGAFFNIDTEVSAAQLKNIFEEITVDKYEKFSVSRSQVINVFKYSDSEIQMATIQGPQGWKFNRPLAQLHEQDNNPDMLDFYIPYQVADEDYKVSLYKDGTQKNSENDDFEDNQEEEGMKVLSTSDFKAFMTDGPRFFHGKTKSR